MYRHSCSTAEYNPDCFSNGSVGTNLPAFKETGFSPWVGMIPWRAWQRIPVFLPGKSHDQGAWWATVYRVPKSGTRLKQFNTGAQEHCKATMWCCGLM